MTDMRCQICGKKREDINDLYIVKWFGEDGPDFHLHTAFEGDSYLIDTGLICEGDPGPAVLSQEDSLSRTKTRWKMDPARKSNT